MISGFFADCSISQFRNFPLLNLFKNFTVHKNLKETVLIIKCRCLLGITEPWRIPACGNSIPSLHVILRKKQARSRFNPCQILDQQIFGRIYSSLHWSFDCFLCLGLGILVHRRKKEEKEEGKGRGGC